MLDFFYSLFKERFIFKNIRELHIVFLIVFLVKGEPDFESPLNPLILFNFINPIIAFKWSVF
jgi:hypothetical protein